MLWREARLPLLAALMAGFGSVISEVGASMMVGGNIRGQTRVLTTAIVLETSKGEFEKALALALLLIITYLINLALTLIQQRGQRKWSDLMSIQDLLVQRNGRDALSISTRSIFQHGETLAIVGPNGAGKSTLLLAMAHLIKPARGQITFNGKPIFRNG